MKRLAGSFCVLLSVNSLAFGYDWSANPGDGSAGNPYQISTAEQLASIRSNPNLLDKHFVLTNDIDMEPAVAGMVAFTTAVIAPDTSATVAGEFQGTAFGGVFDGNGHKIMNLIIDTLTGSDSSNDEYGRLGLFGRISPGGEIRNLRIENSSITGGRHPGWLGGLCAENYGTISDCHVSGRVTGGNNGGCVGGLCGLNDGTVSHCYATGNVNGNDCVGGLCARNLRGTMSYCYASGRVSGGAFLGGLCGNNDRGTFSACFWDIDASGLDTSDGGTGLTTGQMQQAGTYVNAGWDLVGETVNGPHDIWTIKEGFDYPKHVWKIVNFIAWDGVDFKDYSFLAEHWGRTDCSEVKDCNSTDLDFSGSIGGNDLGIFATYWLSGK